MDSVLEWITRQWLEIVGVAVTIAALIYAHLAYRTSEKGLAHSKQAELNSFRVNTKAALNDAQQAQVSLELTCQIYRANQAAYDRKQGPMMGIPKGMFERSPIDEVQYEGIALLRKLAKESAHLDSMDLKGLEALQQRAKAIAREIQALAGKLETPR
jgi:hypothetical protein